MNHRVRRTTASSASSSSGKRKVRDDDDNYKTESLVTTTATATATIHNQIQILLDMERTSYPGIPINYLTRPSSDKGSIIIIQEEGRRKLCQWCYDLVDHFGLDREVVAIAMNYLDRCLALRLETNSTSVSSLSPFSSSSSSSFTTRTKVPILTQQEIQLLAATSLYLAIKMHGRTTDDDDDNKNVDKNQDHAMNQRNYNSPRKILRMEAIVVLSRGAFSVETIASCERQILHDLNWRINPPTSHLFLVHYWKLLLLAVPTATAVPDRTMNLLYQISRYFAEIAVGVSTLTLTYPPSLIAYVSILCAMKIIRMPQQQLQQQQNETAPFPRHAIHVAFLQKLAQATGLYPDAPNVQKAQHDMIHKVLLQCYRNILPIAAANLDDNNNNEESFTSALDLNSLNEGTGKLSPVSVMAWEESSSYYFGCYPQTPIVATSTTTTTTTNADSSKYNNEKEDNTPWKHRRICRPRQLRF